MYLVFLDECGIEKGIDWDFSRNAQFQQRYFVLAAVLVKADCYLDACVSLRHEFSSIDLSRIEDSVKVLGLGFEIKASSLKKSWWQNHPHERNVVLNAMLSFPKSAQGTAIVAVVDKERHQKQYINPENPPKLAFAFIFERLQMALQAMNEQAVCIYDQTKFADDQSHETAVTFIRGGTDVTYTDIRTGKLRFRFPVSSIVEFYLGCSNNCIGIQVADYFARLVYERFKSETEPFGWSTLYDSLHRDKSGKVDGCGLKIFP